MTADSPREGVSTLSGEVTALIDPECDRFEAECKAGRRPRIEDYIGRVPEAARDALRCVLERLAGDYFGHRGDGPTRKEEFHAEGTRPWPDASGRYRFRKELGEGHTGLVSKEFDNVLGRKVAVKVLKSEHLGDEDTVRRFIEEAQTVAQLQHPAIVPVYDLGWRDGHPFFVMKLSKGPTFKQLLNDRASPMEGLSRLLKLFEQACQGVAYAHGRSVVHRDLKPSNLMVDDHDGVQVADWGFKKMLRDRDGDGANRARDEARDASIIRLNSGLPGDASQSGSVRGSLPYMPPEQAAGDVDAVDERADVFALGSILCEILTGKPAYTGETRHEIYLKALRGDTTEAFGRLDSCVGYAELVTLAKLCLAFPVDKRPRDAGEVVAVLAAYHALEQERLRRAELEQVEARARAEEEARRRVLADRLAEEARARAEEEARRRVLADRLAEEARARARDEVKRRRLTVALASSVVAMLLLAGGGGWWYLAEKHDRLARSVLNGGEAIAEARSAGQRGRWGEAAGAAKRAVVLLGPDADPHMRREASDLLDKFEEKRVAEDRDRPVKDLVRSGEEQENRGAIDQAIATFRKAVGLKPDYPEAHGHLGRALARKVSYSEPPVAKDAYDEAIAHYSEAIRLDRDRAAYHSWLGDALWAKRQHDEAIAHYREAIRCDQRHADAHCGLAGVLAEMGSFDEAMAKYKEAILLKPNHAEAMIGLGFALYDTGQFDEAIPFMCRGYVSATTTPGRPRRLSSGALVRAIGEAPELNRRLPMILRGEGEPASPEERLKFAKLCLFKGLHVTSARLSEEAFAAKPDLAIDIKNRHRYNAACAAALAGCGRGRESPPPDEPARVRWRKQAVDWLKADLTAYARAVEGDPPGERLWVWDALVHWTDDRDLAGLRDDAGLAKLPAAEREICRNLWADVEALLKQTR